MYDAHGRPIDLAALEEEHAEATVSGVRSPYRTSQASGLNPVRLASLLRQADEGDVESFLTLAEEMEERDLHYRSVLSTRKLGVAGAPFSVDAASKEASDEELATEVNEVIVKNPNFEGLVADLLDGLGKGFAVVEILWDSAGRYGGKTRWVPRGYRWRDQRWFRYDREHMATLRLLDDANPADGVPLEPYKFITHAPKLKSGIPLRGGLARLACVAFMAKSFTLRDWLAFMDVFGMPIRVGKYGPGATKEEVSALRRAVANIGTDAAAIMPEGSNIEFIETAKSAGGHVLFQNAAEWWDKQVSKGVLGQTMTSDDGASLAQSKTHENVRLDILAADARSVCASLNRDLVRAYVDLNHGPREAYPALRALIEEPEDLEAKARTLQAVVGMGVKVPLRWARDEFGIPEPEEGEEVLEAPAPAAPFGGGEDAGDGGEPAETKDKKSETSDDADSAVNQIVAAINAAAKRRTDDILDELADEHAGEWRPMMQGTVGRLLELVDGAKDFESFRAALSELRPEDLDSSDLEEALAVALFKARGLGSITDRV